MDHFVGEFSTLEDVEQKKREVVCESYNQIKEDIFLLDEMVKELKNVFPKPESVSRQQYKDFVKANYPKFFELFHQFMERRTDVEILDFFFSRPNGNGEKERRIYCMEQRFFSLFLRCGEKWISLPYPLFLVFL